MEYILYDFTSSFIKDRSSNLISGLNRKYLLP